MQYGFFWMYGFVLGVRGGNQPMLVGKRPSLSPPHPHYRRPWAWVIDSFLTVPSKAPSDLVIYYKAI